MTDIAVLVHRMRLQREMMRTSSGGHIPKRIRGHMRGALGVVDKMIEGALIMSAHHLLTDMRSKLISMLRDLNLGIGVGGVNECGGMSEVKEEFMS